MIKIVMPMKRRLGMSVEEFRDYYENHHRLIGEKYLSGYASKYLRRFTNPTPDREGNLTDPEFDVFLEIWYPDMETMQSCSEKLSEPEANKEIYTDEEKLFDTNIKNMRSYILDEFESDI